MEHTEAESKSRSTSHWNAFVKHDDGHDVVTTRTQKELKELIGKFQNVEVLAIVRGKNFATKVRQSFDIISK